MEPQFSRAQQLMNLGRYDQAAEQWQLELARNPNDAFVHAMLGICFSELGQKDNAIAACQQAIGLAPDSDFTHHAFAAVLNDLGQYKDAEASARQAVAIDPEDVSNHRLLATVLLNRKQWTEALASAETALTIDSEDVDSLNTRAVALTQLGRRDEAGQAIDEALRQDPDNPDSHANIGWTMLHAGRHKQALEHFREALRLEPNHAWARQGILEALKARHFIYRWLLMYFLWMSRFPPNVMMGLVIGMVVAVNLLSRFAPEEGPIGVAVSCVIYGYLGFVFLTWLGNDLFNLLLRLDRFGRMVLDDSERRASTLLGLSILLLGSMSLYSWSTGMGVGSLLFFLPILGIAGALRPMTRQKQILFGTCAVGLILAATTLFLMLNFPLLFTDADTSIESAAGQRFMEVGQLCRNIVVWGSVAMTWICSITSIRRP